MYIPAVPLTPMNQAYIEKQRDCFLAGDRPPDFPKGVSEVEWVGTARAADVIGDIGKLAMGLQMVGATA